MDSLYADNLVRLTERELIFRHYYFPFGAKRLPLSSIRDVQSLKRTLRHGSWRIWGTGDFRTWFPLDLKRPSRETIFLIRLRHQQRQIGFTVEDSTRFTAALDELKYLQNSSTTENPK